MADEKFLFHKCHKNRINIAESGSSVMYSLIQLQIRARKCVYFFLQEKYENAESQCKNNLKR